ncbi:MAG: hypothetical protein K5666_05180 [Bacilli bacterium]|nr:hypothetical protein [Bacilli bacterium]
MGFIVDFGVKVQGTQNYNIEDIDYEAARRWGATTDTAFVMWITPNKKGTISFANTYYPTDTIDITLNYSYTTAELVEAKSVSSNGSNSNEVNNIGKYTVTHDEDTIKITDINIEPYVGGNIDTPKKWVGLIVDFGVVVQGVEYNNKKYTIEDIDRTCARDWGATTDTAFVMWLTTEKAGTYRFKNIYYEEDTFDLNIEFDKLVPKLITAKPIDVTNANQYDNPGIVENAGDYNVSFNGNTITVEDKNLTAYTGLGDPNNEHKWMGLIVDFGVDVQGVEYNGTRYTIEDGDRTEARRWGAESDTAFVMWMHTGKTGTYRFKSLIDENDTIDVDFEFKDSTTRLVYANAIDGTKADNHDNPGIIDNDGRYNVTYSGNKITVEDINMIPYVGGNSSTPKKWVGILVDLNAFVDSTCTYGIENADRTQAKRWGATNDTTFIMWLTTEKSGTYTFVNQNNANDTISIEVEFVQHAMDFVSASSIDISQADANDPSEVNIKNNEGKYEVVFDKDNNKVIVNEDNMIPYVGGNQSVPKNWVGLLLDFGVEVDCISNYNIEEEDRTQARRWGATTDTAFIMWLTTDRTGSFTFANKEYANDTYTIDIEFNHKELEFVSASSIDISKANTNDPSEVNIKNNEGKYEVVFDKDNNKVIVNEDNMIPYVGGNQSVPKNWVGLLLDFGVEVDCISNYNIEEEDRTQARRWGATTDTAFIMWLTTDKGGSYTFADKYYTDNTYTIDIEFNHKELEFVSASSIDISKANTNDPSEVNIKNNEEKYEVVFDKDNNKVIVNEDNMIPYVGGNQNVPKNWVGLLLDFGSEVVSTGTYNIEEEDRTQARRWGATTDTAFIMWLTTDKGGSYTFANKYYTNDTYTIDIEFNHDELSLVSTDTIDWTKATNNDNPGIVLNAGRYSVAYENNTITVDDISMIPYKGGNLPNEDHKWIGIVVDLGANVQGTELNGLTYNIDEIDRSDARRWGATTDTAFVMWIRTGENRTYRFYNMSYPEETIDINVNFEHKMIDLESVQKIDISNIQNVDEDVALNINKYTVQRESTDVTIYDNNLVPYTRNEQFKKWTPVLVDLGVKVECTTGYEITQASYDEAQAYGATTETTFVMWLNTEDAGTYTFKNVYYPDDTFDLTFTFVEPELNCNANPYDERCPDLDQPLDNRIVLGENEQLITSQFDVEVDTTNGVITLKLRDGVDYIPGNYKIYVWPSDNREGVKDQPFTLLDNYYNFDMAEDATIYSGTGTNIDDNNVWKVKLTNVENIDLTKITLESVTLTEDETQYDYTDNFEIVDRQVDANDPTVAYLYIGATLNVNDNIVSAGDYDLEFSYSNPEFSNVMGTLEKHTNITVIVPNQGFVDVSSSSHRLSSRPVYYEFVNYNRDTNMVTIKSGNDTLVLTATEFVSTYSGVDLDELTLDEDGSVLYPYNAGILIKSYSQVDGVNTIKYYDNENVLHTMPYTEFQQTYGNIDFNKYNYVDDAIYIKVNGKYREYETMSRNIGYSDGGKFEFVVNYGDIDPEDFDHIKTLKLVHNADGVLSNEAFTIYHTYNTRMRLFNRYYYFRHSGEVDADAADSFDLITEVNRNNHTIKFTIVYDNNIARYIGEYKLTMELFNTSAVYEKTFTIEESSLDFYLASSVDKHESSVEPLLTNFPQGNKKYEYYLSLRMVKGTEDPYYQYSTDSLGVKIYSKLADKESGENGAIYFYDQQDYVLKIKKYKNNVVTYLYSEEVDKNDSQRTYVERTETLDGNSDFEKLYTDAYNLLDKYVFNEDGSIDTTTDNYTKSIVYKKRENNTDYVKYRDGNNIIQLQANSYYATTNELDTLLTAFRYLDFDENGDVVVGSIIGSYKSHIYEYDEAYDVTDLFDISISSTNRDYPITILPKTEVNGGVYYTYVQYSSSLYGVGYLNNIVANGGSHESLGEVVIRPETYPSLWNRNIHMSTITYLDPVYSITLGEHQFTNTLNDTDELYSNAQSKIVYEVKPKDIFKYEDIVHKLQRKNSSNQWEDVATDKYSYYLATKNGQGTYDEIEDLSNYTGKYYLVMTTNDTLESGDYRLVVEYTNPNNNISLVNPVTAELQFTKFLGLSVNEASDELVVPHNDSVTKTVILDGENIADPSNISVAIYYNVNGYGTPLNKQGNEYYYTVSNETHKYFDTSYEVVVDENEATKIQYKFNITNVSDVTQIGNYVIRFTYSEPNEVPISRDVNYQITNDQYIVKLENVYPKVQSDEKSFTMDLTTMYISSAHIDTEHIDISLLQFVNLEFVNVSDEGIANRQVSRITITDVTCENEVCTGKVTFYLNDNINMEDLYNVKIRYGDVAETYAIDAFEDMFAWDLAEQKATSIYTYTEDNEELSREVDGIYKNLSDQKISIKVDTDIYKDKIKWSINDRCISDSGNTCTTADMYGDLFNEVNTTDVDQKLVLTPTRRNNSIQIPNGRYALVLYYSENDYKVVEFEVHSEYIHIDVDLTGEYGEATIKSTFNSSNGSVDVDGMYTNLDGVLTLPTVVTGADYSRLTRYVTDSMGNRVTKFTVNDSIDFVDTHTTKVIYESRNNVAAGDYILVTEYVIDENESIKFEYAFTVQSYYFDFNIMNDIQVYPDNNRPKYLYNNKAGKIVYTIQTQNLTDLDRGSNNGKMYEFMNNSKMLDADGNDVSNYFTFNVKAHNDIFISFKFDIEVSFAANVVPMGSYKLETFYTMSNKTVTKSSDWVTIDVSNRDFRIGEVEIDSPTEDHLVHTSHGGTYVINYTSNVENTKDKITVKVLLNDVDKTNNFTIEKTNTQVLVTVSENTNAIDGNYVVVITFEGDDSEVPVTLYDDYNPYLKLSSTVFDIVDNVIYIKNVSSNNFTLSGSTLVFNSTYFINNLSNLQEGFKVLNKNGENITHTVYRIGTGTKIYNPGDNITYTVILVGDVNQDGGLSLSDAARLFAHTTNKNPITDQKVLQAAKVRGKDAISLSDVAKLYNFIRGKITSL